MLRLCLCNSIIINNNEDKLPFCTPDNLKLNDISKSGNFYLLNDGTFRYEMNHCKIRRFNSIRASACLRGLHLVFMGDSLSRYFYLSLVSLIGNKYYYKSKFAQKVFKTDTSSPIINNLNIPKTILSERDYQNWDIFYKESNIQLNQCKNCNEVCDCFRDNNLKWYSDNSEHQQQSCFENRHFRYVPTGDYNDQINDIRISYIQWYGAMPIRGHKIMSYLPRNNSIFTYLKNIGYKLCGPGYDLIPVNSTCSRMRRQTSSWDYPEFFTPSICNGIFEYIKSNFSNYFLLSNKCQKFEKEILSKIGTTHLILNIGWHDGLSNNNDLQHRGQWFLEKLSDAAEKYFINPYIFSQIKLPRVTWRSTTAYGPFHGESDKVAKEYSDNKHKMGYFDIWELTEKLKKIDELIYSNNTFELKKIIKVHKTFDYQIEINHTNIHLTFVDPAHMQPWVYAEIHNAFLSSVCPLNNNHLRPKKNHLLYNKTHLI
jgi:hypothetical protein